MKRQRNKIFPYKNRLLLVGFLALHLLFLSVAKEHFHNHKLDGKEHHDCPVLMINHALTAGITSHFEIKAEVSVEIFVPLGVVCFFSKPELTNVNLRAPPIV